MSVYDGVSCLYGTERRLAIILNFNAVGMDDVIALESRDLLSVWLSVDLDRSVVVTWVSVRAWFRWMENLKKKVSKKLTARGPYLDMILVIRS